MSLSKVFIWICLGVPLLASSIPMLEKVGENNTIRVLEKAPKEGESVGSYTIFVYDKYDEFVVGRVAPRDGEVYRVWFLEKPNSFELFIWSVSAGSGSYGTLDGYTFKDRELKKISINPPSEQLMSGYMGRDIFRVDAKSIYRSFPIYSTSDSNSDRPSETRCLVYSLSHTAWKEEDSCNLPIKSEK